MCDIKTLLLDINKKSKIFSSIDLKKGFLQVPLNESSKPITAFSTHPGHYHYNVAPMGLTNSPLTFCRLMSLVLQGLLSDHVLIYMDDILVTSETREEHVYPTFFKDYRAQTSPSTPPSVPFLRVRLSLSDIP